MSHVSWFKIYKLSPRIWELKFVCTWWTPATCAPCVEPLQRPKRTRSSIDVLVKYISTNMKLNILEYRSIKLLSSEGSSETSKECWYGQGTLQGALFCLYLGPSAGPWCLKYAAKIKYCKRVYTWFNIAVNEHLDNSAPSPLPLRMIGCRPKQNVKTFDGFHLTRRLHT